MIKLRSLFSWCKRIDKSVSIVHLVSDKKDPHKVWTIGRIPDALPEPQSPKDAEDLADLYFNRQSYPYQGWSEISSKYSLLTKRETYDETSTTPLNYTRSFVEP